MTIEAKLISLAQAVGADVKALKLADGDLTSLSTTAKDNLVAALNEVFDLVAAGGEDPTKLPLEGGNMTGPINDAPAVDLNFTSNKDIGAADSNYVTATTSTTTTIATFPASVTGAVRYVDFQTPELTLQHNSRLLLPGSANILTTVGDKAKFRCAGGDFWVCDWYRRANGQAVVASPDATKLPLAGGRMTGPIEYVGYGAINAADNLNLASVNANTVRIDNPGNGAITINNIASGTSGTRRIVFFNGAGVTLVHNSGLTILPGNANIVAAPGDHAEFACEGGATWRCMWYMRRDGTALVSSGGGAAIDDTAGTGDTDVTWSADKSVTFITDAVATLEASLMGGAGSAYDTFKELQDLIIADQSGLAALAADIANRVRFDAAQTLDTTQKTQARTNIGAVSQADVDATIVATVGDVAHDFVADYVAAKA